MGPFACANLLFSGQVAEVPGSIWGHSETGAGSKDLKKSSGWLPKPVQQLLFQTADMDFTG